MFSRSAPYILLLSFLYGSTLVISRFSVGQYDPRVYISLRLSLAAVAYAVVYWTSTWGGRPKRLWPRDRSVLLHAAILGIIGTAIPMTSIVSSLQYQSTGVTSMLLTLNPAITVVLAQLFLADEPMTWRKTAGVIVALVGAAFLLLQGETGLADFAQADWRGYAWAGVGILGSAAASVYARRFMRTMDTWDVASVRMIAAAATIVPVTYFTVGFDLSRVNAVGYAALLYAALVGTFLGMWLSFYVVKRFGATPASQTSYIIPVISTTLGALVLGEVVTPIMLLGMVIIFTGIALLNSKPRAALRAHSRDAVTPQAGD